MSTWRARWLFCAAGYYRYDRGYAPELAGLAEFGARWCTRSTGPATSTWPDGGWW
ncbi:hypothetical protein [Nocardioides daphniae]|uniref:hypothetical protein n=1 Tax=Nocardioides daphniae TaxID=402297 RepID=UPI001931056D|nr:hypothetical protein [Nocardioides daphniae]